MTERLRRGETLQLALWTQPGVTPFLEGSTTAPPGPCIVTASGRACPLHLTTQQPGPVRLSLAG